MRQTDVFIHGDKDDFVPTYMVNEVYAANQSRKKYGLCLRLTMPHRIKTILKNIQKGKSVY